MNIIDYHDAYGNDTYMDNAWDVMMWDVTNNLLSALVIDNIVLNINI